VLHQSDVTLHQSDVTLHQSDVTLHQSDVVYRQFFSRSHTDGTRPLPDAFFEW
jgi:hypothetical protein